MPIPTFAVVKVGAGSREATIQGDANLTLQSCNVSLAWGTEPAQGTLVYVPKLVDWTGAAVGARLVVEVLGFKFWGYCRSDAPTQSSHGNNRTIQFIDNRDFLKWDKVKCAFNMPDRTTTSTGTLKRYWHILPWDFDRMEKTYTLSPYSARQILNFLFNAPTVQDIWLRIYHFDQRLPVYDLDWLSGETLQSAVARVTEAQGLVVTLMGAPFQLVWARKGEGAAVAIPPGSDQREISYSMTDNPTAIEVLGERDLYQVHDIEMVPDWAAAWQQFWDPSLFVEEIYNVGVSQAAITIGATFFAAGTAFSEIGASADDPEQTVARMYARSFAYEITVAQYAELVGDETFLDFRKYAGRTRVDMPAILYINHILFRAFRLPDDFFIATPAGPIPANSVRAANKMVAKVTHDPETGEMFWDATQNPDGNGYAIVQGYQVGKDLFETINPDRFDPDQWDTLSNIWQHHQFSFDDNGGENPITILFDDPVIKLGDQIDFVDGYAVTHAAPDFSVIPAVRAALPLLGSRFSYTVVGASTWRVAVENVGGLNGEFVGSAEGGGYTELPYSDGFLATEKAQIIGQNILNRQQVYATGRFKNPINPLSNGLFAAGRQLQGNIDRITVEYGTDGAFETVYLTNEQPREHFVPERDLDRGAQMQQLFPGQREMQVEAHTAKLIAASLKTNAESRRTLGSAMFYINGAGLVTDLVPIEGGTGSLPVGAPLWKKPNAQGLAGMENTLGILPVNADADMTEFVGFTLRQNEPMNTSGRTIRLSKQGVLLARVKGPVSPGDSIGKEANADYVVKGGTVQIGQALQEIEDDDIKLIKVQMGAAGGSINWKGEWQNQEYGKGDLVIRGSRNSSSAGWNDDVTILSDGAKAGLFIAKKAVPMDTPAPDEPDAGEFWETFARYATHIFAVRDKNLPTSGKVTIITVDKTGTVGIVGASGKTATLQAGDHESLMDLLGEGGSFSLNTADCLLTGLDGELPRDVKLRPMKSCATGDLPGEQYIRGVVCTPRIKTHAAT